MNEISVNYKTAVELNQRIIITAQAAQQNLYEMCALLKQMKDDKLYKELGYSDFEDYCENEIGISRRQGQKYSKIGEMYLSKNGKSTSHFKNLGTEKLYLLASLSEEKQEEIQEKVDLENTSVRKLKEEIARLKEESESAGQRAENERQRRISAETDLLSAKSKNRSLTHDLDAANSRINELESRPVEVAVETDTKTLAENERLQQELEAAHDRIDELSRNDLHYDIENAKATIKSLNRSLTNLQQDSANELNRTRQKMQREINRLNEQLEKQKSTVQTVEIIDTKEIFKAYYKNAIGAFNAMLEAVSGFEDAGFCITKIEELLNILNKKTEALKEISQIQRP